MNIGLVDVDGHGWPNLALMKISAYHKAQGDEVEWCIPLKHYDRVYKSKVFSFTPDNNACFNADEVIEGGTGYAIHLENGREVFDAEKHHDLPPEIEKCCPDYSIYPFREAYGHLTRGCPRGCSFCIVGKKEGLCSRQVADLSDWYRGQREIKLLDPNILACRDREKLLQQLIDSKAKVDFSQGLDIRMIHGVENLVLAVKTQMIHFAWDNPRVDLTYLFSHFKEYSGLPRQKLRVYVLTNFDSTLLEDEWRVQTLRSIGYNPYVMIYDKAHADRQHKRFQRYVNSPQIFQTVASFEEYEVNEKRRKEKDEP